MFSKIIIIGIMYYSLVEPMPDEKECTKNDCSSIYCNEDFLYVAQRIDLSDDSQNLVDMKLKNSPDEILTKIASLKQSPSNPLDNPSELKTFVKENFDKDEAIKCDLIDSDQIENTLHDIQDPQYKAFFYEIIHELPDLARRTPEDLAENADRHSMISLPECYICLKDGECNNMPQYWENYLIVRGLMANNMVQTATGIMRNIAHLIHDHNVALYSNRKYYLTRSQIPFLALMVEDYMEYVEISNTLLQTWLSAVEKELQWWLDNKSVTIEKSGKKYTLFHFRQSSCNPRPEKCKEDFELVKDMRTAAEKSTFYSNLHALSESGFQFSSRYTRKTEMNGSSQPVVSNSMQRKGFFLNFQSNSYGGRLNLDVMNIVPVELNCILHKYATLISAWYAKMDKPEESAKYTALAKEIHTAIREVLFNPEKKVWFDWDLKSQKSVETFFLTNLSPLFTQTYGEEEGKPEDLGKSALAYLAAEGMITIDHRLKYFAIPTSNQRTGEINDYPYASILLNLILIEGLEKTGNKDAVLLAREMASMLLKTTYEEFKIHGNVKEIYNVIERGAKEEKDSKKEVFSSTLGFISVLLKEHGEEIESSNEADVEPKLAIKSSGNTEGPDSKKQRRL